MILFRFLVQTLAIPISWSKLNDPFYLSTKAGREIEARLQTATSSAEVYYMISVHRLLDLMVPRCC